MKKFIMNKLAIFFAVVAAAMISVFALYLNKKSNFKLAVEKYVKTLDLSADDDNQKLEVLKLVNLPLNIKLQLISEVYKEYDCRVKTLTSAMATAKQKRVIKVGNYDFCSKNVFSNSEVEHLEQSFKKIAEQNDQTEVELFGLKSKTNFKDLVSTASVQNKYFERIKVLVNAFNQVLEQNRLESLQPKLPKSLDIPVKDDASGQIKQTMSQMYIPLHAEPAIKAKKKKSHK